MPEIRSADTAIGKACAKVILVGEHAVVYGYPALAVALPDATLQVTWKGEQTVSSWDHAWEFDWDGRNLESDPVIKSQLFRALSLALLDVDDEIAFKRVMSPCTINISSRIPIGAGMGSSAALSVALVRMADQLHRRNSSPADLMAKANAIDSIFHGKASGLDVGTIASGGLVRFMAGGEGVAPVSCPKPLHLVLVDSGERTSTRAMVEQVAKRFRTKENDTRKIFRATAHLTQQMERQLQKGRLDQVGELMTAAHDILYHLNLSSVCVDDIVQRLLSHGALGAKITGGGGGGFAMALFAEPPPLELNDELTPFRVLRCTVHSKEPVSHD